MLPLMLLGVWVAVLCTVNDSVMLGMAKPAYPAIANGAKLLTSSSACRSLSNIMACSRR